MSDVFALLQVVFPYMPDYKFLVILAIGALTKVLAASTYMFTTFVFPITVPIGCAVFQYLIIGAYIAVIVLIVYILIFLKEAFLGHRVCVRE